MRPLELVAHRGAPTRFPENTLPGIAAALGCGACYVEVDVQMSADGIPVLFHDATLERLCGVPGAIADHGLADLSRLSPGDPRYFRGRYADLVIPTLRELVALWLDWPAATLFVEVKEEALARFGCARVYATVARVLEPIRERVVLLSFGLDFLLAARRAGWPTLGAVVERWRDLDDPRIAALSPRFLFTDLAYLPPDGALNGPARRLGARLAVYEVADPGVALALAGRGVDLVETFAIAEMRGALGQHVHGCR